MKLTILLPTLNEEEGLASTLETIPFETLKAKGYLVQALIVDGASTDRTVAVAQSNDVQVIVEPRKGYGRAYKTGFDAVRDGVIVTGDADATYPFELLPDLLPAFQESGDAFWTLDRFAKIEAGAMTRTHVFGNRVLSLTSRVLFGSPIRDSQSGMWFIDASKLDQVPYRQLHDGMPFSQEIKLLFFRAKALGAREVPGSLRPRVGEAKLESYQDGLRNLAMLFRFRFKRLSNA